MDRFLPTWTSSRYPPSSAINPCDAVGVATADLTIAPGATDATRPPGVSVPVPDALIEDAARTLGYRVLPAPAG
jgi:hypothetical protein